jgi:hypothetical protein
MTILSELEVIPNGNNPKETSYAGIAANPCWKRVIQTDRKSGDMNLM